MYGEFGPAWLAAIFLLSAVAVTEGFRPPFSRHESVASLPPASRPVTAAATAAMTTTTTSLSALSGTETDLPPGVRFRCGRPDDEPTIAFAMARELMNPLGISSENFVVAEDLATGERLGWAQIRPLGPAGVDPAVLNGRPGSIRPTTAEDDVDELIWEEFEEDNEGADFSGGWRSTLPWSDEYRSAMEASRARRDRRAELVAREEANRRRNPSPRIWELASVYVVPDRRSAGIGRSLVRSVLELHGEYGRSKEAIYALTLSSTVDWYAGNFGFVAVEDPSQVPKPMAFEVAAGTAITKLMGNQLVCLRLPLETMAKL